MSEIFKSQNLLDLVIDYRYEQYQRKIIPRLLKLGEWWSHSLGYPNGNDKYEIKNRSSEEIFIKQDILEGTYVNNNT